MLQVKNLTIIHKSDLHTLIDNLSFTLNPGDRAAIIGEEGNGKSTLLKVICQPDSVEDYIEFRGDIITGSQVIGYLKQEYSDKEKELSVYEYCSGHEHFWDCTPKELNEIASKLGLNPDLFYSDQIVGTLSGGEKVKLSISMILTENPDVIFLDEPSNDIDIDTLKWLEHFINTCEVPVLYISHDETLLENTANMIIHLEQIKRKTVARNTVVKLGYSEYVTNRLHSMERQEQEAVNERREYAKKVEKIKKIDQKITREQEKITRGAPAIAAALKRKLHTVKSMEKRLDRETSEFHDVPETEESIFIKLGNQIKMPNGKIVADSHVDSLMIEDRILARNIDMKIIGPKKVCIIGANGCGKTTYLKILAKQLLDRKDIKASYMPQNYEDILDYSQTPVEFLTITGDKEENVRICTYLGSLKFTAQEMNHSISELSGGQKAKLLFLRMSLMENDVLILDEPTRNFSPLSNPVIRQMLRSYKGAIISVSHDRKYIKEVCDTVYRLDMEGLHEVML